MTDHSHFLAAIIAVPDDDAPRLIYADYLEENGEPERAEFIRVQCEIAKCGPEHLVIKDACVIEPYGGPDYFSLTGSEEIVGKSILYYSAKVGDRIDVLKPRKLKSSGFKKPMFGLRLVRQEDDCFVLRMDADSKQWSGEALRRRERELQLLHQEEWMGPCRELLRVGDSMSERIRFTRGFVHSVTCSWQDWLTHHTEILQATPLKTVKLTTMPYIDESWAIDDVHGRLASMWPGIRFELPPTMPDGTPILSSQLIARHPEPIYWHAVPDEYHQ